MRPIHCARTSISSAGLVVRSTWPTDSLVLLLCDDDGCATMRIDLPPCAGATWLQSVLDRLVDPPRSVLMLVYADTVPPTFAESLSDWVLAVLEPLVEIIDCLVVHDGEVRSLYARLQAGLECVPLASLANHPVVAACVAEGLTYAASREHLAAHLQPVDDEIGRRAAELLDHPREEPYEMWRDRTEVLALAVLRSGDPLTPPDVALLGQACRDVFVRDPLLALLMGDDDDPAELLRARTRLFFAAVRLPDRYAGPVAATAALLSWVVGDGAQALVAAGRAMAADATNTLAPLVIDALGHGLPPTTWHSLTQDIPLEVLRGRYRRSA